VVIECVALCCVDVLVVAKSSKQQQSKVSQNLINSSKQTLDVLSPYPDV
jgi:hypothetical protein